MPATQNNTGLNRAYYDLIDPLRGFAAISVLVYHVIEVTGWRDFPAGCGLVWFRMGWMGTDIFFVISGFVITLSALNLLEQNNNDHRKTFLDFADRRLRRIVPLHLLTMIFFTLVVTDVFFRPGFWSNLSAHIAFIHNWFPEWHGTINAPNWTLGLEMQFYLLLILIIPYVNNSNIKYFVAGAFIIAFAWRYYAYAAAEGNAPQAVYSRFMAATQLPGMLDFFALGMLAAFFSRSKIFADFSASYMARFTLFAVIVIWGAMTLTILNNLGETYWHSPWTMMLPRSMSAILFALLITMLCAFRLSPRAKALLSPLVYLGVISYGIYLFHWPVLKIINRMNLSHGAMLLLTLGASIALASLSWHFYEKRFMRKKRH